MICIVQIIREKEQTHTAIHVNSIAAIIFPEDYDEWRWREAGG